MPTPPEKGIDLSEYETFAQDKPAIGYKLGEIIPGNCWCYHYRQKLKTTHDFYQFAPLRPEGPEWPFYRDYPANFSFKSRSADLNRSLLIWRANASVLLEFWRVCDVLLNLSLVGVSIAPITQNEAVEGFNSLIQDGIAKFERLRILNYEYDLDFMVDPGWCLAANCFKQTQKRVRTWTVGKKPKDQVGIPRDLRVPV